MLRFFLRHRQASRSAVLFSMLLATGPLASHAAVGATSLTGKALTISTPCLNHLHITTSDSLSDAVQITQPLPAGIKADVNKDHVVVISQQTCPLTGDLTITTQPSLPLTIENSGSTAITLDDRKGTVFVRAGSAPFTMGRAAELGLVSDSTGPITITTLSDSARIRSTVSAPVTIKTITAPAIALYLGGSATFTGESGKLQALEITSASTGDAVLKGETDVGMFHSLSSGNIVIDKVTGTLAIQRDGSGKVITDAATPRRTHSDRVSVIP